MNKFFTGLVFFTSILLAASAAYYSVFGLSHLFAGAKTAVIIMAGSLEFAKLVTASALHRHWEKIGRFIRVYLTIGVIVLIGITSAGIYGFLSNAYQQTANQYDIDQSKIAIIENKNEFYIRQIDINQSQIESKEDRIKALSDIRSQQEARLDTLYKKQWWNSIRRTEALIKQADEDIRNLNNDIEEINVSISAFNDSINVNKMRIIQGQSGEASAELGPLLYLSDITGKPMDQVVNYFILLLVFVFDPLAVCLLIVANTLLGKKEKKEIIIPVKNNPAPKKPKISISTEIPNTDDSIETPITKPITELIKEKSEKMENTEPEQTNESPEDLQDGEIRNIRGKYASNMPGQKRQSNQNFSR